MIKEKTWGEISKQSENIQKDSDSNVDETDERIVDASGRFSCPSLPKVDPDLDACLASPNMSEPQTPDAQQADPPPIPTM